MDHRNNPALAQIFSGWEGYNESIVAAIAPLSVEQLNFRPAPNLRSVGELVRHIAFGRFTWWARMQTPGSADFLRHVQHWHTDEDGNRHVQEDAHDITADGPALVLWINRTWQMIERTLAEWNVTDLSRTYRHVWNGETYAIPMQWTIFRILAHDIHHGGELALTLGMLGLEPLELGALGGHIVLPSLAVQG